MSQSPIDRVFRLLSEAKDRGYIGEEVSQLEHGLQAAHFAKESGASEEEILAALFHDIGHLEINENTDYMDDLGVIDHEEVGAKLLLEAGFSEKTADLVRGHVQAKRYLVAKNLNYGEQLSSASVKTLEFQGGAMNENEMADFEKDPLFKEKLRIRKWDEMAKEKELVVEELSFYRSMVKQLLGV